jgi:Tfp pilus assembly protein PilF/O-antigen ligase
MLSKVGDFFSRQRPRASHWGLAFLLLSPLFFVRALEDAYVLPQRILALLGLVLGFACLPAAAFNRSRLLLAALVFFAWRLFTHAATPGGASGAWAVEQLAPLGALVLVAHAARRADEEAFLLRLALVSAALVAAYALALLWGWDPWDRGALDMGFLKRAHGSLGNPDFLAGFLVLALPGAALAWLALPADGRSPWLRGTLFFLIALALLLTQVRGAWLAAAVSLPLALYVGRSQIQTRRLWVLLVLALGLAAVFSLPGRHNPTGQSPLARVKQSWSGDGAWAGRRFMAHNAWNLARTHPVLGVGPGHFQDAYLKEQGRLLSAEANLAEPYRFTADIHDDWLQVLAESGWMGLGLLLWVFSLALRGAWRRRSVAGAALLGLLTAFGVQALFHFPLGIQASALFFWGAVGLVAAWDPSASSGQASGLPWAWLALPLALGFALTLRQAVASASLNTGTVLRDGGRPAEAVVFLQKAATLWPQDSRAWMRLGLAQDALGRGNEAAESFRQATVALEGLPEAWSNLGLVLGKMGQLAEAQRASERALDLNPRSGEAWSNLAKLRYLQGDAPGAIADLENGLHHAGPSALLYFNLGAVYLNVGQRQPAKAAFEQCLRLQPDHAEAQRLLKGLQRAR